MALSKIKEIYKDTLVVFKGSKGVHTLGTNPDIDELAILAHRSGDKSLQNYFEVLPPLDKLLGQSVEKQLEPFRQQQLQNTHDGAKDKQHIQPTQAGSTGESKADTGKQAG